MPAVRLVLAALVFALATACGPAREDVDGTNDDAVSLGKTSRAIIGGSVDTGDPAVVALATLQGDGKYTAFCTGTLIAPQTVLSAGHCVDPSREVWAVFGTSVSSPSKAIRVEAQFAHPDFDLDALTADISVWKLAAPVIGITPVQHNTRALSAADVGQSVRHIGYGVTDAETYAGANTKRQVTYAIRSVDATEFESGATGKQTCFGDSGGPALAKLPGQPRETVVGVVSWGDKSCLTEGFDTRVDVYASSFIEPLMAQWEMPQCTLDGRCRLGCTPVDADCACANDGVCSPACPNLSNDPDCPADCGANGVCALDACPAPDPDCVAIGEACASDEACNPRLCVDDPQHPVSYCSTFCDGPGDCPATMTCDEGTCRFAQLPTAALGEPCDAGTFCTGGAICDGPRSDALRCVLPCSAGDACPAGDQTCMQGLSGGMFCAIPESSDSSGAGGSAAGPKVLLPHARADQRRASSCSSTGGSPVWALGLIIVAVGVLARRRRTAGVLTAATALALSACGPTEIAQEGPTPSQLASLVQPIVGGTVDNGDPEVFELAIIYNNGTGSGCTGTLIGNRTIATAAHCADPAIGNASSSTIYVMNQTQESQNADWIKVVDRRIHPGWDPFGQSLGNDIAMLLLEKAPAAPKKQWNSASISNLDGHTVRAVGYGITSNSNNDSGTKRQVNLVIDQHDSTHIYVGNGTNKGICHGDSGGPSFYTFPDGVERLVAIHSFDANGDCTYGGDIRTDAYTTFINQWFLDKEGPQCGIDGACKAGCATMDPDCYCGGDGVCDLRCPSLLQDPDCPKDCVKNGVCSTEPCPEVDDDCVGLGQECNSELQCQQRLCISDPQNPDFYCSRPCSVSAECPATMECVNNACIHKQLPPAGYGDPCTLGGTFCTGNTVCTGATSDDLHCEAPCATTDECAPGLTCEYGQGGFLYCRDLSAPHNGHPTTKSPVFLDRAKVDHVTSASGCAAVGSGPLAALGLLSLAFIRRRRAA